MPRTTPLVLAALLLAGCTVMDVHTHDRPAGLHSTGLIHGHASVGFTDDPPVLNVEVFDGRSPGALFLFDMWHLLRLEVGFVGAAVGVGPLDLGLGLLAYRPVPQAALDQYRDSIWHVPAPPCPLPPPPLPPPPPPPPVPTTILVPAPPPCPPEPPGRRVPIRVVPPW